MKNIKVTSHRNGVSGVHYYRITFENKDTQYTAISFYLPDTDEYIGFTSIVDQNGVSYRHEDFYKFIIKVIEDFEANRATL